MRIILYLFLLGVFITLITRFIQENRKHLKRVKNLNQWSEFHNQLMEWSDEIVDINIKHDFNIRCIEMLTNDNHRLKNDGSDLRMFDDWSTEDIEEEKQKIFSKWGKHIPSLTQEMREKKLNQIL